MAGQITLKPLVDTRQQRPDGTYNVKVRVTYKRKSRILATTITAPAKDVDKNGILKGESLNRGYRLISRFQGYINELDFFLAETMDVDEVVRYIRRKGSGAGNFRLDFFQYAESEFLPSKPHGTSLTYITALNAFKRFISAEHIDINEITKTMLQDFAVFIDNEPKVSPRPLKDKKTASPKIKGQASVIYTTKLRKIFREAAYKYNDEDAGIINIPKDPFLKLKMPTVKTGVARTAQEPEVIQRLIDYSGKLTVTQRISLDIYLISFALMGMNTEDMMEAAPLKKGVLIYNRAKTRARRQDKAEHRVLIDPRIAPLIEKHRDPSGTRLFNFYLYYKNASALNHILRASLHAIADRMGIPRFTIYAARHSWATIARSSRCGIDKATVDDCLVHVGDHRLADVYAEKDWQVFWDANKKVLDIFDWSAIQNLK